MKPEQIDRREHSPRLRRYLKRMTSRLIRRREKHALKYLKDHLPTKKRYRGYTL